MPKTLLTLILVLLPGLAFAGELIHTTATLSEARSELAATSVGNLALFAGGSGVSGYSDTVDIYHADTGAWSTAALSQPRRRLAGATVGNLALFAGGKYGGSAYSDRVDIYDAQTGTWSTASLSGPRCGLTATSVGSLAMFAGGYGPTGESDVVDIFDAQTGLWTAATLSRAGRAWGATVGDKALFAMNHHTLTVDIYDAPTGSWPTDVVTEEAAPLCAATAVGDKALFADAVGTVHVYDDSLQQWTTATLSRDREHSAATSLGGVALFAGGRGEDSYTNVVDMFQYLPAVPHEIPEPFTRTLLFMGVVTLSLVHFMAVKNRRKKPSCEAR